VCSARFGTRSAPLVAWLTVLTEPLLYGGCTTETDDDVMMDIELPFWIDASDVRVSINSSGVSIEVRNTLSIQRTYWRNRWGSC